MGNEIQKKKGLNMQILEKLEKQQRVTQKALDKLNEILREIDKAYKNEDVWVGDIEIKAYRKANGFTFSGFYFYLEDVEKFSHGFIPKTVDELNTSFNFAGDFNTVINYIDKYDLLYIIKNIKKWIEEKALKEEKLTEEFINILENNFK